MESPSFDIEDYDYHLPEHLIARFPPKTRTDSRLLVLHKKGGGVLHSVFSDLPHYMNKEDVLILNDTRVFPARLMARKPTGGRVEVLLLDLPKEIGPGIFQANALVNASRPVQPGTRLEVGEGLTLVVQERYHGGPLRRVEMESDGDIIGLLEIYGKMPIPPYLKREEVTEDRERYQTVYAKRLGSVAAPTAGLHFTKGLLSRLSTVGVRIAYITLHVGYGTFSPIKVSDIRMHKMHSEWVEVPQEVIALCLEAKSKGRRVICVGTTTVRAMEYVFLKGITDRSFNGPCDLYIYPGFDFKVADAMITNFHLPRTSLLVLVSAFAGRKQTLRAYEEAVRQNYRFFSYGDAMLIL